jgi:ABC transporter DrrB family efflux protein
MSVNPITIQSRPIEDLTTSGKLKAALTDAFIMVKRNLKHIPRTPELLMDVTVGSVIFVLLFRYVFGGAIAIEGTTYINYLMAGIFVQTIMFAAMSSGIYLAQDLQKGLIDRFSTLPMSASAVVAGRTLTDLLRGLLAVVIMLIVGLAVGFRPEGSTLQMIGAFGLALLFGFAFSWIGVSVGMLSRTPEAVQAALYVVVFPLTFASSAFVPTETMPNGLRQFAENQPMSVVVNAMRSLMLGESAGTEGWLALAWSIGLLVIFFPIAVSIYKKRTTQ